MLQEPMMEKLMAMRMTGMVDALKTQEQDPASRELSFLERLALLVDQQWSWRENQALARRLHAAKLKGAAVEDIDYRTSRGLDKSVIRALAQKSAWVEQHENVFVLGPTGVGKSFVACALAQKACRDGYSALYLRAAALFRDLAIARADGSLRSVLARLSRIDVLVIDDWAMAPLAETERRDFWEICEDRYQARSTIRGCPDRSCRLVTAGNTSYATCSFDAETWDGRPRMVAKAQRSLCPSILRKCCSVSSQAEATQRWTMSASRHLVTLSVRRATPP